MNFLKRLWCRVRFRKLLRPICWATKHAWMFTDHYGRNDIEYMGNVCTRCLLEIEPLTTTKKKK